MRRDPSLLLLRSVLRGTPCGLRSESKQQFKIEGSEGRWSFSKLVEVTCARYGEMAISRAFQLIQGS